MDELINDHNWQTLQQQTLKFQHY